MRTILLNSKCRMTQFYILYNWGIGIRYEDIPQRNKGNYPYNKKILIREVHNTNGYHIGQGNI